MFNGFQAQTRGFGKTLDSHGWVCRGPRHPDGHCDSTKMMISGWVCGFVSHMFKQIRHCEFPLVLGYPWVGTP